MIYSPTYHKVGQSTISVFGVFRVNIAAYAVAFVAAALFIMPSFATPKPATAPPTCGIYSGEPSIVGGPCP